MTLISLECQYSPFCDRVQMALDEAKAEYTRIVVDLKNKPAWFTGKVTPAGKVYLCGIRSKRVLTSLSFSRYLLLPTVAPSLHRRTPPLRP